MNELYIKHPNGYCYFKAVSEHIEIIPIVLHLVNQKIITQDNLIKAVNELKSLCQYNEQWKYYSFQYVSYDVQASKSIGNPNDGYDFDTIEENFITLSRVNELINVLLTGIKPYIKDIRKITTREFKEFLSDQNENLYIEKKANYYEYKLFKEPSNLGYYEKNAQVETLVEKFKSSLKHDYPCLTILKTNKEYNKALKFNFDEVCDLWQEVLDEQGNPNTVEGNSAVEHFQKSTNYALFTENFSGVTGYLLDDSNNLVSINEAQLFKTVDEAENFMKYNGINAVICEIGVNFQRVIKTMEKVNLSHLECIIANQEKEKLELSDTFETLGTKMLQMIDGKTGCENLEKELKALMVKHNEKITSQDKPKRQKI